MRRPRRGESKLETILGIVVLLAIIGGGIWFFRTHNPLKWFNAQPEAGEQLNASGFKAQISMGKIENGTLNYIFDIMNEAEEGDLTNVELQLTFHPESGPDTVAKESWASWKKGEKKSVVFPAAHYKKVDFEGTCDVSGKRLPFNGYLPFSPPTLTGFSANFDYGPVRHQFEVTNETTVGDLANVELVVTFEPESGTPVEIKESWGSWKKGEKKKVSVRSDRYKRVDLKGTVKIGDRVVPIKEHWTWQKPYRPAVNDFGASIKEQGTLTLTNRCKSGTMRNIQVTIQLTRSDGIKHTFEATWEEWFWEEKKEMSVPANRYRAFSIKGRASIEGVEINIEESGTWSWD